MKEEKCLNILQEIILLPLAYWAYPLKAFKLKTERQFSQSERQEKNLCQARRWRTLVMGPFCPDRFHSSSSNAVLFQCYLYIGSAADFSFFDLNGWRGLWVASCAPPLTPTQSTNADRTDIWSHVDIRQGSSLSVLCYNSPLLLNVTLSTAEDGPFNLEHIQRNVWV